MQEFFCKEVVRMRATENNKHILGKRSGQTDPGSRRKARLMENTTKHRGLWDCVPMAVAGKN